MTRATVITDKKELIRTLVKWVIIEPVSADHVRRGRIVWQDGVSDTHFEFPTCRAIGNRILDMQAEGLRPRDIADRLNQDGLRTIRGQPWTVAAVTMRIKQCLRRTASGNGRQGRSS
jgi:hypothetical protein